jgi:hypothetical protein
MTVMTLMTVIYGLILDRGRHLYFVGPLTASSYPTNPTLGAENLMPVLFSSL